MRLTLNLYAISSVYRLSFELDQTNIQVLF